MAQGRTAALAEARAAARAVNLVGLRARAVDPDGELLTDFDVRGAWGQIVEQIATLGGVTLVRVCWAAGPRRGRCTWHRQGAGELVIERRGPA